MPPLDPVGSLPTNMDISRIVIPQIVPVMEKRSDWLESLGVFDPVARGTLPFWKDYYGALLPIVEDLERDGYYTLGAEFQVATVLMLAVLDRKRLCHSIFYGLAAASKLPKACGQGVEWIAMNDWFLRALGLNCLLTFLAAKMLQESETVPDVPLPDWPTGVSPTEVSWAVVRRIASVRTQRMKWAHRLETVKPDVHTLVVMWETMFKGIYTGKIKTEPAFFFAMLSSDEKSLLETIWGILREADSSIYPLATDDAVLCALGLACFINFLSKKIASEK